MRLLILKILSQILFLSMLIGQYNASIKTARMYEIQQNWDSAIFIYNAILSKSPNNYQVIRSLKNLYKKSQRYNEGINFLIYQLSKNSKDIQLSIELGEFYFLNENITKAKSTWAEGLILFKNNRSFHRLLFSIYDKYNLSTEIFQLIESGRNNFDKGFLSIELGNYYQKRNEYDKAIEEYITSLLSNPGRSSTVARKILVMSDDLNSKNTIEMKLLETSLRQPSIALPILSNHYFKHREFQKSFNALIELSKSEPFNAKKWLSFGNNLRKENEYFLSIKAYQLTLKNNLKGYQYGEGLLGLAKTFEDQILPTKSNDLIPYFYNDNIFFEDLFQLTTNISSENLTSSLSIYDSILTSIPGSSLASEAEFRLAEIQYRVIEDFDKAYILYKSALSKSLTKTLEQQIILRIADVLRAKGDFTSSISFLDSMYNTHQTLEIKNKLVEMHLFSGKPDTALIMINEIFLTIMPTNKFFNDLMELRDLINFYYVEVDEKSKEGFINYLKSESLLKQRKISEANQLLKYIIKQNEEQKLFPLLCLRRAIILTKLNKYNEALDLLTKLKNTIYSDRGEVMSGQIYEQIYNDKEIAMRHFMKVINEFPNSIFSEPIRYHIRKLKSDEKI